MSARRLVGLTFALTLLAGCSAARFRVGPIGSGIALPANGPGIEAAVSDANGTPMLAGRLSINLPAVLSVVYDFVRANLPGLSGALLGDAPVPTGPEAAATTVTPTVRATTTTRGVSEPA